MAACRFSSIGQSEAISLLVTINALRDRYRWQLALLRDHNLYADLWGVISHMPVSVLQTIRTGQ